MRIGAPHNFTKHSNCIQEDAGFTLLETLVSLVILSITIGMSFQLFAISASEIKRSEYYANAGNLLNTISALENEEPVLQHRLGEDTQSELAWSVFREPVGAGLDIVTITVRDKYQLRAPLEFKKIAPSGG